MPVSPTMEPIGFVAGGDFIVRDIACGRFCPSFFGLIRLDQILRIGDFKESAGVAFLAGGAMVFKREEPMSGCSQQFIGKYINGLTVGAFAVVPFCGAFC